jgi:intracellular multiplication protein IcmN
VGTVCSSGRLALASLLLLTSCSTDKVIVFPSSPSLPYKVEGTSDAIAMTWQDSFNKNGIQVITEGQDYLIRIPTVALFPEQSPRIAWGSYKLLNDVVCYLKQFRKIAVSVTAYSSGCVSSPRERALTLARARVVGNYLWSQGIDSRFVFTHGLGNDKPIVAVAPNNDKSANSRIEITFRDAVA